MNSLRKYALIVIFGLIVGFTSIYLIDPSGNFNGNDNGCGNTSTASNKNLKNLATGEMAGFLISSKPEFVGNLSFNDENGKAFKISDFKGNTILLNLWATWCAPCREEMPYLDSLQKELGGEKFKVVAVSVDNGTKDKPLKFLSEIGAKQLDLWTDSSMGILADLRSIGKAPGLPTTMLIDENSCEIGVLFGPANWASEDAKSLIREVLARTGSV